jgi:CheY-like chemotaxis protein
MDERRQGPDRRRRPRGGRRPTDIAGYSPLVMVLDSDHRRRELSEAILAKLQFAVAPVETVDRAIAIAHALRPSVIVCPTADTAAIRERLRFDVPVVAVGNDVEVTEALVEVVRAALRAASL